MVLWASVHGTWDEFDECVDRDGDYDADEIDASSIHHHDENDVTSSS